MGIVEIHTWNAQADAPYLHDRIVLDFDPGPAVSFEAVVAAALLARSMMDAVGLRTWVKTTGGKGLHVVAPIEPTPAAECLAFARSVAMTLVRRDRDRFTTTVSKQGREAKILIDVLRNNRTNTSVAAYSLRARAGAPVSLPLAWDDLGPGLDPRSFNAPSIAHPAQWQNDPWRDYAATRQRLPTQR
jgi:bifunctional non-homologous end joining protein LigD